MPSDAVVLALIALVPTLTTTVVGFVQWKMSRKTKEAVVQVSDQLVIADTRQVAIAEKRDEQMGSQDNRLEEIHTLVNGHSTQLNETIRTQAETIAALQLQLTKAQKKK